MKKFFKLLVLSLMLMSLSLNVCAASSVKKTASNSEFGTLTGEQDYIGKVLGRKNITFSVKTTKTASKLLTSVEIQDYATGKTLDGDMVQKDNAKSCGYTCDCHSSQANSNSITSHGTHEARGKGSLVVYTTLSNLK